MTPWLETYLTNLGNLGFPGAVVFFLSFAVLSLLGLPLIPFGVMAGLLFGFPGGLAGMLSGAALGASIGFFVSRYVARERVTRFLLKRPRFRVIDRAIAHEGWKIVVLLRLCPIPFGVSNFAYGLTDIRFWHYLPATLVGILPGTAVAVCMGAMGKELCDVKQSPAMKLLMVVGILALFSVLAFVRRIVVRKVRLAAEGNY